MVTAVRNGRDMEHKYPNLFSPMRVGNVTFRNRIFSPPASHYMVCPPAYLTKECRAFYELRAIGGAAAVCLGDSIVDTKTGYTHPYKILMDDPAVIPSISALARDISRHGATPSLELTHGGKFANVPNIIVSERVASAPAYGPSHEINADGYEILEMREPLIEKLAGDFGKAAARAKACGFQMITVHGGHGWLLAQFMSPGTNKREDKYGGSRGNRLRFPMMALDSIRAAVGPGFPIEFRMSGAEFTPGGYDIGEGVEIAKLVAPKVDILHVSAGFHDNPDTFVITHPSMFHEQGCNVWLAAEIKRHVDVPVVAVGALSDPAVMEEIIASGKADFVAVGRGLLADPYLPRKAFEGRDDEIVRCVRCFTCLDCPRTTRDVKCAVNPVIGREWEHVLPARLQPRKSVLVAGGGPGGMTAAITAAERGHSVTLCEASDSLGGQLKYEKFIPFKRNLYEYSQTLARRALRLNVDVRLNTAVTPELAAELRPDAIVAAVGADYIVPDIPGIDGEIVRSLPALDDFDNNFGKRVVIFGGGLVGCETAIHLRNTGRQVTIVEMRGDYAADAPYFHKQAIRLQLGSGIEVELNMRAVAVRDGALVCVDGAGEERVFEADTVFCATGMRSRLDVVESLRYCAPAFFSVGDCVRPGHVTQAVSGGCYAAMDI